ncbi:tyrosine-type recombinase/integrase [Intestinibacter sp.]|uniref:tyrosine-type recombinase/integrase n=1 Tax=Intestinibacter sp. TaxID=1965304 RepID=UPI002A91D5CE|nr:tyrosine-type recombinase/integrase [Intestinibacter sp.]MDY5212192.1 tyrosine-type recombinase/integrase [Intestinibacter sp.]
MNIAINEATYNERFILKATNEISKQFGFNIIQERALYDTLYRCTRNIEMYLLNTEEGDFYTYIDLYIKSKRLEGLQSNTLKNVRYKLVELNNYVGKKIDEITITDLKMYILHKQDECLPSTVNGIITCIKEFFKYLYDDEYIKTNPARKLKKMKEEKRLKHSLNEVVFEHIRLNCKNSRDRAIVEFLYATGLRVSELVSLNRSDIDPNANSLKVIGKGNKERFVIYSDIAKFYLQKYLSERKDDNDALFVSTKKPYNRLSTRGVQKIFEKIKKELGLSGDLSPHILRHTFATRLAATADITTVQKLLGHTNIDTTLIYAELSNDKVAYEYKKSKL